MEAEHTPVVTRIGFAERWLHRARAQCADGDVSGGLLTLALADAEVRYALETAGPPRLRVAPPARRLHPVWWLAAAAAVVAAAWLSLSGMGSADVVTVDGPPVVRFARVGSLLASMTVRLPAAVDEESAAVAGTTPPTLTGAGRIAPTGVRVPQPAMRAASTPGTASASASRASTMGTPAAPAAAPAPTATTSAPPPWFALSDADLIEMVIAASRALQGTGP